MYNFTLEQGSGFAMMFLILAAAIFLAGIFYLRAFGQLNRRQWQSLLLLRSLAILLVVMLIFRPVYSYHKELANKPGLILLLDRSASMSIADDPSGVYAFQSWPGQQIEKWREKLQRRFRSSHAVEFAENARPLERCSMKSKNLTPDGPSTSLAAADRRPPRTANTPLTT